MPVKQNSIEVRLTEEDLATIESALNAYLSLTRFKTTLEKIRRACKRLEKKNA